MRTVCGSPPCLDFNLIYYKTTFGAGEGNRTLTVSLEGFCSTIELHPRYNSNNYKNLVVEEEGFEPSKLSQEIYSLPPLAARESLHKRGCILMHDLLAVNLNFQCISVK